MIFTKQKMKFFLLLTIILTIISIIFIYFDWDRKLSLKVSSINSLLNTYSMKPKSTSNRVVAVIKCNEPPNGLCNDTIKTLLDQSIRLHDIAVETNNPQFIDKEYLKFVSIHEPDTTWLREPDSDTIIIRIENGKEYSYDYIENEVDRINILRGIN
jgi:hypothetical protein